MYMAECRGGIKFSVVSQNKIQPLINRHHYDQCHLLYAGSEAMFADLGHFNKISIQVSCAYTMFI